MEVRSQVEELSQIRRKLTVEVPSEVVDQEFERVAGEFRKRATVPGFRPGKAPLGLVKRRYHADIRDEVIGRLVPEAFQEALRRENLKPVVEGDLQRVTAEPGQALNFEIEFDVAPEFELPEYKGVQVEIPAPEATVDELLARRLEVLRAGHGEWVEVTDRPAAAGDRVHVRMEATYVGGEKDGQEVFEEKEDKEITVILGSERNIEEFEKNLTGVRVGDKVDFVVEYPEREDEPRLSGQKVRFQGEVTSVKEKQLPELNDEFARDLGNFESLEQVKDLLRRDLEASVAHERREALEKALREKLLDGLEFEVPGDWVTERLRRRLGQMAEDLVRRGIDPSQAGVDWRSMVETLRPEVIQELRWELVLDRIAEQEGIEVSEEAVDEEIWNLATALRRSAASLRAELLRDEEAEERFRRRIARQRALDIIEESAVVTEVAVEEKAEESTGK
ncbi:MAG: trigger factor [Acidobacteriota bacterium]